MEHKKSGGKNVGTENCLVLIQKNIEIAAGKVAHHTKLEREKCVTPENVTLREEAAARCFAKIKRKAPKEQARQARAKHQVKFCLHSGKRPKERR